MMRSPLNRTNLVAGGKKNEEQQVAGGRGGRRGEKQEYSQLSVSQPYNSSVLNIRTVSRTSQLCTEYTYSIPNITALY